jgi:hypothetical protein
MTRKKTKYGWPRGGKYSLLEWLPALLPEAHHYCEPSGGSATARARNLIPDTAAPLEEVKAP